MKVLKISILILAPIGLSVMFGSTIYNCIQSHFINLSDFTDTGCENAILSAQKYLPLVGALSFFAFFAFFVPTANLLFPNATSSIKEENAQPMPSLQPCIMQVVRTGNYNTSLFNSLNNG